MVARELLEGAIVMFLFLEVIVPLFAGRPLFPLFRRRKAGKLIAMEADLRQKLEEDRLRERIAELEKLHNLNLKETPEAAEKTETEKA